MDIKRVVFDEIISRYKTMQVFEKTGIEKTAELVKDCILNGGVVQLCGIGHGEEFVNELNYRAGGIAPMHGIRVDDLFVRNIITEEQKNDFFNHKENIKYFEDFYELHNEDMYILVSLTANEPLLIEMPKKAKENQQKVVFVCNRANVNTNEETVLDYCDVVLDICDTEKGTLVALNDIPVGQAWTTTANVMAQMITGEVYRLYQEEGRECPVLLSANLSGADIHNNSLTDPYGKRVR